MQHVDAADANFSGVTFHDAKLIDANLRSAEFTNTELHQAECGRANLESACLKGADLRGTSLVDADLYNADLRDAEIDHETDFGTKIFREFVADNESEGKLATKLTDPPQNTDLKRGSYNSDYVGETKYTSNWNSFEEQLRRRHKFVRAISRLIHRIPGQSSRKSTNLLEESEEIYSNIKQLCRSNPVPQKQRHFNIREKEIKRKRAYCAGSLSWCRWSSLRWSMLYGESAKHVIVSALVTILVCAILYPIFGVQTTDDRTVEYSISGTVSVTDTLDILFFSLRRLISTSNGGYVPIGASEWIALIQTTIGALLVAMLVFTLGRRATT
ncbi:Ion transport 2 domain-containing protein [Halorubrum aidingense JCM 13560]|uniref:Ion transport 2 domain-containing protein n=2 Tax=Halorubrum aidingense TaxID=368623 RepID=M0P927_9EURY|nr:Ion transport 2 domain-containing protein [Halorubrum aidingense JCM 13560]